MTYLNPETEITTILCPNRFVDTLERLGEEIDRNNYQFTVSSMCEWACYWAAKKLDDAGLSDFEVVRGSVKLDMFGIRRWNEELQDFDNNQLSWLITREHAWLEYRDKVYDLTLAQFDHSAPKLACLTRKDANKKFDFYDYERYLIEDFLKQIEHETFNNCELKGYFQ